jgi:hypothetical protein
VGGRPKEEIKATLTLEFANQPLAQYAVDYEPDRFLQPQNGTPENAAVS